MPEEKQQPTNTIREHLNDVIQKVVSKIDSSESILVALSKDPSVDDLAAAIGLTMMLDKAGKHATAIYSGATPNAIEFLEPEKTLEPNTNSLQDFIIALNKEKADHLRYKIEGDFVKVYITPYRSTLTEKDLAFEHGDFNVDLVVAIDVENGEDLDQSLAEYGRIMHDATAVNITNKAPGHFAEVEWSDPESSSVCEMIVKLVKAFGERMPAIEKDEATALLTGIVAATDKFSNELTSPDVMALSAELMKAGADQQLISSNIDKTGETQAPVAEPVAASGDPGKLTVEHDEPEVNPAAEAAPEVKTEAAPEVPDTVPSAPEVAAETAPAAPDTTALEPVAPIVPEPAATEAEKEMETIAPVVPGAMPGGAEPLSAPVVPEVPAAPEVPEVPEMPVTPEGPEVPEAPTAPELPAVEPIAPEPATETATTDASAPAEPAAPLAPLAPLTPEAPLEPVGVSVPQAATQVAEISPTVGTNPDNLAPTGDGPVDYGSMMDSALSQVPSAPPTAIGSSELPLPPTVPDIAPGAPTVPDVAPGGAPAAPAPAAPDLSAFQIPGM